jgi:hypothetical protein
MSELKVLSEVARLFRETYELALQAGYSAEDAREIAAGRKVLQTHYQQRGSHYIAESLYKILTEKK